MKSGSRSFKQWLYDKLHARDIFARPITLNFNQKPAFATVPGGLCSIISISLLLLFCVLEIYTFLQEESIINDFTDIKNHQFSSI